MSRLSPRNVLSSEAIWCTVGQLLLLNKQSKSSLAYNNKHINTLIGLRIGWKGSVSDFESEVQLQWLCFTCLSFLCSQGCFFLMTITEIQEAKAKTCVFGYCQGLEQRYTITFSRVPLTKASDMVKRTLMKQKNILRPVVWNSKSHDRKYGFKEK